MNLCISHLWSTQRENTGKRKWIKGVQVHYIHHIGTKDSASEFENEPPSIQMPGMEIDAASVIARVPGMLALVVVF